MNSRYGPIPEHLTIQQKLALKVFHKAFIRFVNAGNGQLPLFLASCPEHGLFLDTPRGYHGILDCPDCIVEFRAESAKLQERMR